MPRPPLSRQGRVRSARQRRRGHPCLGWAARFPPPGVMPRQAEASGRGAPSAPTALGAGDPGRLGFSLSPIGPIILAAALLCPVREGIGRNRTDRTGGIRSIAVFLIPAPRETPRASAPIVLGCQPQAAPPRCPGTKARGLSRRLQLLVSLFFLSDLLQNAIAPGYYRLGYRECQIRGLDSPFHSGLQCLHW